MDGQKAKQFLHRWRKKRIPTWLIVLGLMAMTSLSVYALRQNNLRMVRLRSAVVQADQNGSDVSAAIKALNNDVFHHMNTQIVRPVELVNTYNKAAQAAIEAANQAGGADLYQEGTAQCERRGIPLSSIAQCISEYALSHASGNGPKSITLPDKNLFVYTFASPVWTPDLAGFSLVITVVLILWLLLRLGEYILVRLIVRRRLRNGF